MSNGDDAMTSAEFAKLMGAYPEPSGNPSPAYGGFMDNSAANFSWVQNNDYFGAEGMTHCKNTYCELPYDPEIFGIDYQKPDAKFGYCACEMCDGCGGLFSTDLLSPDEYAMGEVCVKCKDGKNAESFNAESADFNKKGLNYAEKLSQHWLKGGHKYVECNFCSEKKPLGQMKRMPYDPEQDKRVRYSGHLSTYAICDGCYRDRIKGEPVGKSVLHAEGQINGIPAAEYYAEMDVVADGMSVISNINDDVVGVVEVMDDKDDDELVELSIQDENMEEIGSFTLDDGEIFDDEDDYRSNFGAETKPSIVTLIGGIGVGILAYMNRERLWGAAKSVFNADNQEVLENDPELVENPNTGQLDPAAYEELVVESTGYALDIIPMSLDGSFMGSRFAALPTERYVDYNDPGIGAHTDIAMNRDENFLEPEMAMVQAAEGDTVVKETQAPGQSPYFQMGQEPADMNYRVIKETHPVSLDPAVKPFIPQSMAGYTGNANTPPSVYNKMFNIGVLGQTPLFTPQDAEDIGASRAGSRRAKPNILGLNGSVGGPLSDKVNANYTDGATSMSLAQWAQENTVSQSSDTEAVVIDRSSGAMKRVRRV